MEDPIFPTITITEVWDGGETTWIDGKSRAYARAEVALSDGRHVTLLAELGVAARLVARWTGLPNQLKPSTR
jgi:hypothetical protein